MAILFMGVLTATTRPMGFLLSRVWRCRTPLFRIGITSTPIAPRFHRMLGCYTCIRIIGQMLPVDGVLGQISVEKAFGWIHLHQSVVG